MKQQQALFINLNWLNCASKLYVYGIMCCQNILLTPDEFNDPHSNQSSSSTERKQKHALSIAIYQTQRILTNEHRRMLGANWRTLYACIDVLGQLLTRIVDIASQEFILKSIISGRQVNKPVAADACIRPANTQKQLLGLFDIYKQSGDWRIRAKIAQIVQAIPNGNTRDYVRNLYTEITKNNCPIVLRVLTVPCTTLSQEINKLIPADIEDVLQRLQASCVDAYSTNYSSVMRGPKVDYIPINITTTQNPATHVVDIESTLLNLNTTTPLRWICIGESGVGKSMLCANIVKTWENNSRLQNRYKGVFVIQLRNLRNYPTDSLLDNIIMGEYLPGYTDIEVKQKLGQYIQENPHRFLFICDGYNELDPAQRTGILVRSLFGTTNYNVIITSTPLSDYPGIPADVERVNLIGFNDNDNITSYVHSYFSSGSHNTDDVLKLIKNDRFLRVSAQNPLQLNIICNLISKGLLSQSTQSTGSIYKKFINDIIYRWYTESNKNLTQEEIKQQFTSTCTPLQIILGELALTSIRANCMLMSYDRLVDALSSARALPNADRIFMGLTPDINCIGKMCSCGVLSKKSSDSYEFIHGTVHEYFASLAIAGRLKNLDTNIVHYIENNCHNPEMQLMWVFVAYNLSSDLETLTQFLEILKRPSTGYLLFNANRLLIRCIPEYSQNPVNDINLLLQPILERASNITQIVAAQTALSELEKLKTVIATTTTLDRLIAILNQGNIPSGIAYQIAQIFSNIYILYTEEQKTKIYISLLKAAQHSNLHDIKILGIVYKLDSTIDENIKQELYKLITDKVDPRTIGLAFKILLHLKASPVEILLYIHNHANKDNILCAIVNVAEEVYSKYDLEQRREIFNTLLSMLPVPANAPSYGVITRLMRQCNVAIDCDFVRNFLDTNDYPDYVAGLRFDMVSKLVGPSEITDIYGILRDIADNQAKSPVVRICAISCTAQIGKLFCKEVDTIKFMFNNGSLLGLSLDGGLCSINNIAILGQNYPEYVCALFMNFCEQNPQDDRNIEIVLSGFLELLKYCNQSKTAIANLLEILYKTCNVNIQRKIVLVIALSNTSALVNPIFEQIENNQVIRDILERLNSRDDNSPLIQSTLGKILGRPYVFTDTDCSWLIGRILDSDKYNTFCKSLDENTLATIIQKLQEKISPQDADFESMQKTLSVIKVIRKLNPTAITVDNISRLQLLAATNYGAVDEPAALEIAEISEDSTLICEMFDLNERMYCTPRVYLPAIEILYRKNIDCMPILVRILKTKYFVNFLDVLEIARKHNTPELKAAVLDKIKTNPLWFEGDQVFVSLFGNDIKILLELTKGAQPQELTNILNACARVCIRQEITLWCTDLNLSWYMDGNKHTCSISSEIRDLLTQAAKRQSDCQFWNAQ